MGAPDLRGTVTAVALAVVVAAVLGFGACGGGGDAGRRDAAADAVGDGGVGDVGGGDAVGDGAPAPPARLRVIVETAGAIDVDQAALVRFLLYLPEWELEGILATSASALAPVLDGYAEVQPALARHDAGYVTPAALAAVVVTGTAGGDGGVERILGGIARQDPRPLWILRWGAGPGAASPSSVRRALDRLQAAGSAGAYRQALSRVRVVGWGDSLAGHAASLGMVVDTREASAAALAGAPGFDVQRDVRRDHGALGMAYPAFGARDEGALTFLYLVGTGLSQPHEPRWQSWGGRYLPDASGAASLWAAAPDSGPDGAGAVVARWAAHIQADFGARLDRCRAGPVNLPPRPSVVVRGDQPGAAPPQVSGGAEGPEPLWVSVTPGLGVVIDASGSGDPDGDPVAFAWNTDGAASTFNGAIALRGGAGPGVVNLAVPEGFPEDQTYHVVLAVTDAGTPPLTRYRRIIFTRDR
jgi:hypothetical protein